MPIEFKCHSCSRTLRVPDGSEGRQCQCPGCSTILDIPVPTPRDLIESEDSAQISKNAAAQKSAARNSVARSAAELNATVKNTPEKVTENLAKTILEKSPKVTVACPHCSHSLECDPKLLGTKGQCKSCKSIFVISLDPQPIQEAKREELFFDCPQCGQLFEATSTMQGRRGRCHTCQAVFLIEVKRKVHQPATSPPKPAVQRQNEQPASTTTPPSAGVSRNSAAKPVLQRPSQPIQFPCRSCNGVMEVPGDTAGQNTMCPYCSAVIVIPATSQTTATNTAASSNLFSELPALSSGFPLSEPSSTLPSFHNDPFADTTSTSATQRPAVHQRRSRQQRRGLTFSNAYGLFFESFIPACFISSILWVITMALPYGLFLLTTLMGVAAGGLHPILGVGFILLAALLILIIVPFSMLYIIATTHNSALESARGAACTADTLFGGARIIWPLLGYFCLIALLMLLPAIPAVMAIAAVKMFASTSIGVSIIGLVVYAICVLAAMYIQLMLSFTPFALLDGKRVMEAMSVSYNIFNKNSLTILGVFFTFGLGLTLVIALTIGLGALLLCASYFYISAAMYELGRK
jgi:DNA-directed RNA polymerase subunit RPC12/RpoP